MKRLLNLLFCLLLASYLYAPARNELVILQPEPINPYEPLWRAVCQVESSGNPFAVNEAEQAYGLAQIRQIRLDDYAQRTGKVYTLTDCFDKKISKEIFMYFASGTYEQTARNWNGKWELTEEYWKKVKQHL